jgi:histidine ammonia-lyase
MSGEASAEVGAEVGERSAETRRPVPAAGAPAVQLGARPLTVEAVLAVAHGRARAVLDLDSADCQRMERSLRALSRRVAAGERIYGVSTGFGESCTNEVSGALTETMPLNLVRFHGCGTGRLLSDTEAAAVLAVRAASLVRGYSAVRIDVPRTLCGLLNAGVLPCIPAEGSVGASGDLTPLSYVAATLMGEREARFRGRVMSARAALSESGITPLVLGPKESLALMNGTSVMTGLACLAFERAAYLARFASALTAMACDVLRGNRTHFHRRLFELKPHPGQLLAARWIREDIELALDEPTQPGRIQDRYSLRCAPHVIGVLVDALLTSRSTLEIEVNSVNDNPIVDGDDDLVLHGGNFYGGHICHIMDGLKAAVASLTDLLDRQMSLLCNPVTSNDLPADLVGRQGADRLAHHGFKAMQIATSALTAEALKLTMPASAFSRSTESHNQDKVSMGTIAARDCLRVLELGEQVAAILLLACAQASDLRQLQRCHRRTIALRQAVRDLVPFNDADRRQDLDIAGVLAPYRARTLPIGELEELLQSGSHSLDSFARSSAASP